MKRRILLNRDYEIDAFDFQRYRKMIYLMLIFTMILCMIYLPGAHDMKFHIYRIGSIVDNLEWKGISGIPYHIYITSFHGRGYASPLFYGDIFLYIPAFLVYIGVDIYLSYQILITMIFFLAFLVMYQSMKSLRLFTDKNANENFALFAAMFYVYSPGFMENLWIRGAIGEALASIFMPLVFCMLYKITVQNDWKLCHILLLSLGISGLLLSHIIITVITAFFSILFFIIHIKNLFYFPIKILALFSGGFLAFCLTAYWTLPFLEQYSVINPPITTVERYVSRTIEWKFWFIPFEIYYKVMEFLDMWGEGKWNPSCLGYGMIVMFFLLYRYYHNIRKKEVIAYGIFAFLLLVFISIKPCNQWTGKILSAYKMQFPWRLLMVIFFLLAITVAYFLICINKKRVLILASTIMIVTASIPTITIYGSAVLLMIQGKEQEERGFLREYDPNYADKLYLPEGAVLKKVRKNKGKVSANHDILFETSRDTGKILISIIENNYNDTIVHIPFLYYKGYTAGNETTGKQYRIEKDSYGQLCINIGGDTGKIFIFYKGTKLQKIANNISMIACIFFLGILGYSLWKKRKMGERNGKTD